MDPITIIVTALATGAAAGLKDMPAKLIADAYEGLKALIKRKYERTSTAVPVLENDPASEAGKTVIRESLEKEQAGRDEEVLRQAQAVLRAVQEHAPSAASAAGVLIEDVEAGASINVRDVVSEGGFTFRRGKAGGDLTIEGVRAGPDRGAPSPEDASQEDAPDP